jgi:hypothetical protein
MCDVIGNHIYNSNAYLIPSKHDERRRHRQFEEWMQITLRCTCLLSDPRQLNRFGIREEIHYSRRPCSALSLQKCLLVCLVALLRCWRYVSSSNIWQDYYESCATKLALNLV